MKKITLLLIIVSLSGRISAYHNAQIPLDTTKANALLLEIEENFFRGEDYQKQLEEAINIYKKADLPHKVIKAKSYLAFYYIHTWQDSLAEQLAKEVLELAKNQNQLPPQNTIYANLTMQMYYAKSEHVKAIAYGEKVLKIAQTPSFAYFMSISALISDYTYNNDLKGATPYITEFEKSLQHPRAKAFQMFWVKYYQNQLQLKMFERKFEEALIFAQKCINENEKYQTLPQTHISTVYVEMGNCYFELFQYKKAIEVINKGIELSDLPDGHPSIGTYYANLAFAYSESGDDAKAIEYSEQALRILQPYQDEYGQSIMALNYNISVYHYNLKQLEQAITYIEKCYNFYDYHVFHMHHANVLSKMGKHQESLKHAHTAITQVSTNFKSDDINQNPNKFEQYADKYWAAQALQSKAAALIRMDIGNSSVDNLYQAIELSELSIIVLQELLAEVKGYELSKMTNSKLISVGLDIQISAYARLYQREKKDNLLEKYFHVAEQLKAMNLLETISPSFLPKEVVAQEQALTNNIKHLEQKVELADKDSLKYFQNQLFEASQSLNAFFEQLQKDYPKESNTFRNIQYANIPAIQQSLAEGDLYIDYCYNSVELFILTIDNQTTQLTTVAIDGQFEELLETHQKLIKNKFIVQTKKRTTFIETSHQLYLYLIAPIQAQVTQSKQLVIVPQKKLFFLPFETLLPTKEVKPFHELDYLIKTHHINYQYSGTIHLQLQNQPPIQDYSFLGFAPVFDKTTESELSASQRSWSENLRSVENNRFKGLPNTKIEVTTIAKMLEEKGKVEVLLQSNATKNQLTTHINQQPYQFLHIATHGMVNIDNPKLSALACAQVDKAEDGLYFANEIQMQDVNADLVILSSCESGIGQLIRGEGILALNRSFIYAGARNVIFSLWKVNDEHSSELMINFYKSYLDTPSYTAALRSSKLELLKDPTTANPRFWAAFLLIGK